MSKNIRYPQSEKPRAKTCQPANKITHYLSSGRKITHENLQKMQEDVLKPYNIKIELKSMNEVKKYWENEKNKKIKEREDNYANHHNYKTRLNVLWKSERLYVPEEIQLPGGSLVDDIDPTFFTQASGRPIKEKKNTREYLQNIKECFMTRLKTGFFLDEILLMDERHKTENKKLNEIRNKFLSCQKGFNEFLKEDYISSSNLLKCAKEEENKSKEKLMVILNLKEDLKNLQAEILIVEEKWRNMKMFQKFLYLISPSEWRKTNDPYYGKTDVGVVASDPCLFDREFPGDTKMDLGNKISRFLDDIKQNEPPSLYFTEPEEVLNVLSDLEKNNLRALTHCKDLDFPAEKIMEDLEKAKILFENDQKNLEEEILYLKELVEMETKKAEANELKIKETVFGLFRDLITNEECLSVTSFVEDAYEDIIGPNRSHLNLITMIKEIELDYENLVLALDNSPNVVMIKTTKNFYKEQKRQMMEAKEAERKVHQMETLLKRLRKSLDYPKKGVKERKTVPRSQPPEEVMFKYKLPKILSKKEKDELFFFGKTPDEVRIHKPLCL